MPDEGVSVSTGYPEQKETSGSKYVIFVVLIAAIGGSLFGYDQGVISGAISFFSVHFKLSQAQVGFVSAVLALWEPWPGAWSPAG